MTATTSDLAERWNLRPVHGRKEWRGTCPACDYADAFVLTERDGNILAWCGFRGDAGHHSDLIPAGIPN